MTPCVESALVFFFNFLKVKRFKKGHWFQIRNSRPPTAGAGADAANGAAGGNSGGAATSTCARWDAVGAQPNSAQVRSTISHPLCDTSHMDTLVKLFAHTHCVSVYLPG